MPRMEGSVSEWLSALRGGSSDAARRLWERYYERILRLVQRHLRNSGETFAAPLDDEQLALDAFDRFCAAWQKGQFPELSSRQQLWPLLVAITLNRVRDGQRAEAAQKRGANQPLIRESQLRGQGEDSSMVGMDQLPSRLPRPDFAALMADECRRLLALLNDAELEQLAQWKLEGLTDDEAAAQLGYSRRSIQRMLSLIRLTWQEYLHPSAVADVPEEAGGV